MGPRYILSGRARLFPPRETMTRAPHFIWIATAAAGWVGAPSGVTAQDRWATVDEGWEILAADDTVGRSGEWREGSVEATWPALELMGYEGTVWFRAELRPDPGSSWDAIVVGPIRHGWYRVNVDGDVVGQVGSPFHRMPYPLPRLFSAVLPPGGATVVLELHRSGWGSDAVGDAIGVVDRVEGRIFTTVVP